MFSGDALAARITRTTRSSSIVLPTLNRKEIAVDENPTTETLLWEDDKYKVFWDEARKVAVYRKNYQGGDHGADVAVSVQNLHP